MSDTAGPDDIFIYSF